MRKKQKIGFFADINTTPIHNSTPEETVKLTRKHSGSKRKLQFDEKQIEKSSKTDKTSINSTAPPTVIDPVTQVSNITTWVQFCDYYNNKYENALKNCELPKKIEICEAFLKLAKSKKFRANIAFATETEEFIKTFTAEMEQEKSKVKSEFEKKGLTLSQVETAKQFYQYFSEGHYALEKQNKASDSYDDQFAFYDLAQLWAARLVKRHDGSKTYQNSSPYKLITEDFAIFVKAHIKEEPLDTTSFGKYK